MFVNNMIAKDPSILSSFLGTFFFLIFNNWLHVGTFVCPVLLLQICNTAGKMSKYGVFSGPNTGKYGPEKTPYLNTFHAMEYIRHLSHRAWRACQINCLLVNVFPTLSFWRNGRELRTMLGWLIWSKKSSVQISSFSRVKRSAYLCVLSMLLLKSDLWKRVSSVIVRAKKCLLL